MVPLFIFCRRERFLGFPWVKQINSLLRFAILPLLCRTTHQDWHLPTFYDTLSLSPWQTLSTTVASEEPPPPEIELGIFTRFSAPAPDGARLMSPRRREESLESQGRGPERKRRAERVESARVQGS